MMNVQNLQREHLQMEGSYLYFYLGIKDYFPIIKIGITETGTVANRCRCYCDEHEIEHSLPIMMISYPRNVKSMETFLKRDLRKHHPPGIKSKGIEYYHLKGAFKVLKPYLVDGIPLPGSDIKYLHHCLTDVVEYYLEYASNTIFSLPSNLQLTSSSLSKIGHLTNPRDFFDQAFNQLPYRMRYKSLYKITISYPEGEGIMKQYSIRYPLRRVFNIHKDWTKKGKNGDRLIRFLDHPITFDKKGFCYRCNMTSVQVKEKWGTISRYLCPFKKYYCGNGKSKNPIFGKRKDNNLCSHGIYEEIHTISSWFLLPPLQAEHLFKLICKDPDYSKYHSGAQMILSWIQNSYM